MAVDGNDDTQLKIPFRDAMRRLAATVTIVSVGEKGRRHGMTATAVTSLSMEPPSLLVCVNRAGSLHRILSEAEGFCINLLTSEQSSISDAFAGKLASEERFLHGDWEENADGLPYLVTAQANIFCVKQDVIEYGSHSIFIGKAWSVKLTDEIQPLLYSNGAYNRCTPLFLP